MKSPYLKFVILLGTVSLLADMTYEGARSITGPFLALLGASGAVVGTIAGFGEFIGYSMRLFSGFITDKTKEYWFIAILGYAINLLAVPLLAFAGNWKIAAFLIILERFGKAIRVPARDAMLSYATKEVGRGFGFGIHEALDKVGALSGPLVITLALYFHESYRLGFLLLFIPALLALGMLFRAKHLFPRPQELEVAVPNLHAKGLSKTFWIYLLATGCIAAGYADFALIAFHFQKAAILPVLWIPLFYAIAMGTAGLSALLFGKLFDRFGIRILIFATVLSALFAPLTFYGGFIGSLIGMILWGAGIGAQGSVMRGMIAHLVSPQDRASAYGIFGLCFGLLWFLGSALMGFLYDHTLILLVLFSVGMQLLAIPLMLIVKVPSER